MIKSPQLRFNKGNRTFNITILRTTILFVDETRRVVYPINFWTGAKEKYVADSEDTHIALSPTHLDRLLNDRGYKRLDNWKPIIEV